MITTGVGILAGKMAKVWGWVGLGRTEKDSRDERGGMVMFGDMAHAALR